MSEHWQTDLVRRILHKGSFGLPHTMIDEESSKVTQAVICSRFFTHHPARATVPTSPIAFGVY